jgi:hypothetical protein
MFAAPLLSRRRGVFIWSAAIYRRFGSGTMSGTMYSWSWSWSGERLFGRCIRRIVEQICTFS